MWNKKLVWNISVISQSPLMDFVNSVVKTVQYDYSWGIIGFQELFRYIVLFAFILESVIPLNVVVYEPAHMIFCSRYLRWLVHVRHGHKSTYKDMCILSFYTKNRYVGAHIWYVIYTHIFVHMYMKREWGMRRYICLPASEGDLLNVKIYRLCMRPVCIFSW
jgi:hypothetical protein